MVIEIKSKTDVKSPLWQTLLFSFCILLILSAGFGYWYIGIQIKSAFDKIAEIEKRLVKSDEEKKLEEYLFKSEKRINSFAQIIPLHKKYFNVFDAVEKFTHPFAQFIDFNFVPEKNQVKVSGKAKDFYSLGQQFLILNNEPRVKEKVFSGITMNKDGGANFSLSIILDPNIFE